jgi:hypothetical protein
VRIVSSEPEWQRHGAPVLTVVTLGATVLSTATRLFGEAPVHALRRDPAALYHGEVWRLVSPVLMQTDERVINVVLVFAGCAAIGVFAERVLTRARWITLYVCGALAGHGVGEAFQPLQGGTSVAFVGILGGLGAMAVFATDPALRRFRPHALAGIPLAALDTALGDIHGAPYLVCFAIGAVWVHRDERSTRTSEPMRAKAGEPSWT